VKLKKTAIEMVSLLLEVYGETLPRACVSEKHKGFSKGREDVKDDE
jgi:hypothetical protein